ncbi:MAG: phenylalanine--tRNA ligase subunit beta [Spirochaetes bacterium]|nr:phenylalanine--tRNA ligase subunit beta [Spirochaetota bacterium]
MLLSLKILSELADLNGLDPNEIALKLTMATAEIDGIKYVNPHLNTVISAKIENVMPHPDADKLTLVDLDTGKEKVRVVCGAPNNKKGDIVALATVGTKFGEEFVIKESKIRGEKSSGMLCSEKELGFSDDHSGIMILPPDTGLGVKLSELFPSYYAIQFDIDNKSITHRPDLWGHVGFAREIAALFGRKFNYKINYDIQKTFRNTDDLKINIQNPESCARYCGLVVKNIKIKESPEWLKEKIISIGIRPISNIVDITNYIMAELGEPMHAFDRKKLAGNEITVRMAKKGEKLKTLDEQMRDLTEDDILITDKNGPVALAGIMGGDNSDIEDTTTEIILEAANFNPVRIRKTAQRLNLRTDAAARFEKALDPEMCPAAIIRCYELIKELIPEAEAATEIIDNYPEKAEKITVNTSSAFLKKKIGDNIDDNRIFEILESLDFKFKRGEELNIVVPSYRATRDISIPEDIVEEVGRIFGYDNITPKPPYVPCVPPEKNEKRLFERRIKNILAKDHHLTEIANYSFVNEDILKRAGTTDDKELRLLNPLSREQDRLRRSLMPGIFTNIELNQRFHESFKIFELGRVYLKDDRKSKELAKEITFAAGAVFAKNTKDPLFYTAKNIAADLISQLNVKNIRYIPAQKDLPPYAHPGRSMFISIDGNTSGLIFEPHPKIKSNFGIKGEAAIFEINIDTLLKCSKQELSFIELQKFPEVPFDVSVLADKHVYTAEIQSVIEKSSREFIKSVELTSVYEGQPVPEGMKSVSFTIVFSAKNATLSPEQIDDLQKKVVSSLDKKGYKLR